MERKILWRAVFFGASENENVSGFTLRSYGWRDLMREKQPFLRASQDENISGIAPGNKMD
ncbi:MAG: hypothetical protein SWX82_15105 [Cyanobacteriota bacterium]|nr:hypothetical protein [Cyanobacteriota bacterium]